MMRSALTAFCFLILLSTAGAAQEPRSSSPATPPAAAPPPVSADYRLVPGDKLRIEVYKDDQLSQSLQVRPDGKITLPLLGDVAAAGKTPTELRDSLAGSLKEYVTNPVVTVIVVEATPPTIYVMGEVNKPGPQQMRGPLSVLQALAMAGGFKDFANTGDITILRKSLTGVQRLRFNYKDAVKGNGSPVLLQPGDTVIVP
ncbi:MAG TPA: polysaccharide biosynthesis/export family protein [Vicinamibacterales bacterium]|nr:polysaccharide biosynthesis/export family protein [Vicinamibacterales bacterium]